MEAEGDRKEDLGDDDQCCGEGGNYSGLLIEVFWSDPDFEIIKKIFIVERTEILQYLYGIILVAVMLLSIIKLSIESGHYESILYIY